MRWTYSPLPPAEIEDLSRREGVGLILAELLARSGLAGAGAASFLHPTLSRLEDPFRLPKLEEAARRLRLALERREQVTILGDYDVDGVTSTALAVAVLRRFGLSPRFVVPRRAEDGYGLSRSAIDRALEAGRPDLFVALDCGTNSQTEVDYLRSQGIDVLVVDHHRSKEGALQRGILLNPHVGGVEDAPGTELCTVGLVFKLMHGLLKLLRQEGSAPAFEFKLRDHLDLVALGTVADLVPLTGENRILARHGLSMMRETRRPGLRALMEVAGLKPEQEISAVDISYRLGPRINASGRLADASVSVELLTSEDSRFCYETARQLDLHNRERQEIERLITEKAERLIEAEYAEAQGIVLFDEDWHPGVVGIVAGRVTRKYHRPSIVLGREGDLAKGSGRSVDGINLVEVLGACREHLSNWGGHPMAVGIALERHRLEDFRRHFSDAVRDHAGGDIAERSLAISSWLDAGLVRESLLEELEGLHPFGQGNPEPVFGLRGIVLRQRPEVFKEQHFRFWCDGGDGRRLSGVAWKMADRLPPAARPIDLAIELHWNHFAGRRHLQMELVDWRPSVPA